MDNATGSTAVFLGLSCDAKIYKRMQTVSNLHSSEIDRVQQQSVDQSIKGTDTVKLSTFNS